MRRPGTGAKPHAVGALTGLSSMQADLAPDGLSASERTAGPRTGTPHGKPKTDPGGRSRGAHAGEEGHRRYITPGQDLRRSRRSSVAWTPGGRPQRRVGVILQPWPTGRRRGGQAGPYRPGHPPGGARVHQCRMWSGRATAGLPCRASRVRSWVGERPTSWLPTRPAARPCPVYSTTSPANADSMCRTNGQWLLRKATSSTGSDRSASLTSPPATEGSAKSGPGYLAGPGTATRTGQLLAGRVLSTVPTG